MHLFNVLKLYLQLFFHHEISYKISGRFWNISIDKDFLILWNFLHRIITKIILIKNLIAHFDIFIFPKDHMENVIYSLVS